MHIFLPLFAVLLVLPGCGRNAEPKPFLDPNGFVLNAAEVPLVIKVGVGMTAAQFVHKNPSLRNVIWVPSRDNVFDELRFSLQSPATLEYDDGVMKFSVCTQSASIDGNERLKAGVATVGFTVCDPPEDDVEAAVAQASALLAILRKRELKIADFSDFYRTASQEELTKIGGKHWEGIAVPHFSKMPAPRDNPESMEYLRTLDQARAYFQSIKPNSVAKPAQDGRIAVGLLLVGVFATDRAIIEVGISGSEAYGGTNLSTKQRDAIRYQVGMSLHARPL